VARKLIVEVVLDAAAYSRQIKKAEAQTAGFATNLQKTARSTAAASLNLKGLGKAVAFSTGGFVAFHSAADFVRESVDAAREGVVAQRALAAQMKASGESFDANRQRIEEVARSYARFGFQNDEVIQSLTVLERGTGNINDALELQGLTADIARAKNLDLAQAATIVAKVFGGQETALRRAVPGLQKNAHGYDLIREAQAKLTGQAAANTTAAERFQATLHDTQEVLGNALLPTLNKMLGSLTKYLEKLQKSDKLQKDVADSATAIGDAFALAAGAVALATDNYRKWRDLTGAGGKDPGFFSKLFGGTLRQQIDDFISRAKYLGGAANKYAEALGIVDKANAKVVAPAGARGPTGAGAGAIAPPAGALGPDLGGGPKRATAEQRNTWFDNMIGRLQLRAGLLTDAGAQIAAYQKIAALLKQQIAKIHDVTRQLNLKDQALQVAAQIAALVKQQQQQAIEDMVGGADVALLQAQLTKSLADDLAALEQQRQLILKAIKKYGETKDLRLKLIQNQIDTQSVRQQQAQAAQQAADQARQEKVGWMEFAYQRAQSTKTIADDIKTATILLNYWKKQAATGKRTLEEAQNVFHWQQELKNLRKGQTDPLAGLMQVSSRQLANLLAAGTGLTAAGRRQLQFNIAGTEIQPVHVHVNLDGREVASAVAKEQARSGNRTTKQTSGRRG